MGCFTILMNIKRKSDERKSQRGSCNDHTPTLQNTPSFRARMESMLPINTKTRTRTLSVSSALDAAEQDAIVSTENEEQGNSKRRARPVKEQHSTGPQPLPLPKVRSSSGSHKSRMTTNPLYASGSVDYEEQGSKRRARSMKGRRLSSPQPLPLPTPQGGGGSLKAKPGTPVGPIQYFRLEEIVAACDNFSLDRCMSECISSTMYMASFGDDASSSNMLDAIVTCLRPSTQGLREFMNEVNTLSSLQHPNICKLQGFHARKGSKLRMLVYERLPYGSLEDLLFRRSNGPSIDWDMRIKIAICAAQGLTFLHEDGPLMAMYTDFSTANIQIDEDFNAKLSGYGCVSHIPEKDFLNNSPGAGNLSVETLKKGLLTPKSNVWSFGIVLLELLTGRKNYSSRLPRRERNLVKWCRPFLVDDIRLSWIMDPQLKGLFPLRAARTVADIAQRCLKKDPSERPTMRAIVECLKNLYSGWFLMQEAAAPMSRLNSSSSAARNGKSISSPKWSVVPTVLPPPGASSSGFSTGELNVQENKESTSEISRG